MAVKPEQIKARLKAKYPKANLSTKRVDALAAKLCLKPADDADDDAIDAVLEAANEIVSFEDIAKDDDRMRTLEANQKPTPTPPAPPAPAPDPNNPNPPAPAPQDDAPAWAKKIQSDLEDLKSGKVTETKIQTVQGLFEKSDLLKGLKPEIKATWLKRVDLNSETPFEEQITALETEYADLVQVAADSADYGGRAIIGKPDATFSQEAANKIVDNLL